MTGDDRRPGDEHSYRRWREAAALVLLILVSAIIMASLIDPGRDVDSIVLGILIGAMLVLLGVEAGGRLLPPGK